MPSILRAGIARDSPGPAVDMILAEDRLDVGTGSVDHVYWALSDRLGSPRDIVEYDATAGATNVVASSDGGAPSFSAIDWVFGFTAREEDDDVGLVWYRARWYDPATGRFVSEDPIGFSAGDPNINRYVGNDPANKVDPSGLEKSPLPGRLTFCQRR